MLLTIISVSVDSTSYHFVSWNGIYSRWWMYPCGELCVGREDWWWELVPGVTQRLPGYYEARSKLFLSAWLTVVIIAFVSFDFSPWGGILPSAHTWPAYPPSSHSSFWIIKTDDQMMIMTMLKMTIVISINPFIALLNIRDEGDRERLRIACAQLK